MPAGRRRDYGDVTVMPVNSPGPGPGPAQAFRSAARDQRRATNPLYELGEIDAGGACRLG